MLAGVTSAVATALPAACRACSARMIGAIFMKLGRAPAMRSIRMVCED